MNCSACIAKMDGYCDGALTALEARAVEEHLAGCSPCAAELASLQELRAATAALPRALEPGRDLWPGIRTRLGSIRPAGGDEEESDEPRPRDHRQFGGRFVAWAAPLAMAASLVLIANVANRHAGERLRTPAWRVASLAGVPQVNTLPLKSPGELRPGQWLVTDSVSRAKVSVGSIGEMKIEPNSRVRLVGAAPTDHRVELARGTLSALIWAPPRLFFVDTPSGTAVDLGCAYTLTVDERDGGELRVTAGYVALEYGGRESIVPAGLMCLTRPGVGPGTPFRDDAPPDLRRALEQFDFEPVRAEPALDRILEVAQADDGVTLWHLLTRSKTTEREAIYAVLARHHPPPAAATRAGVLALDRAMLRAWAIELGLNPLR